MQEFSIKLKDEKVRTYRILANLILFIHLAVFLIQGIQSASVYLKFAYFSGVLINLIVLLSVLISKNDQRKSYRILGMCFLLSSVLWLLSGNWVPALSSFIMGLFGFRMAEGIVITCNSQGIEWPYFPKRIIPWGEITHIILKDGMLTVEDKRNRVLQAPLTAESSQSVSELDFNRFCLSAMSSGQSA